MTAADRLAEIEARLEAATRGPWEQCAYKTSSGDMGYSVDQMYGDEIAEEVARMPRTPQGSADAHFISHARQDVPALVAFARAVQALHVRVPGTDGHGKPYATCSTCLNGYGEPRDWPCVTGAALQELGSGS